MAVSQPLSANENFSRPSLRSLAPLLNDLPPPSFSPHIPSPRPTATEHSCQNKNLKPHPNSASFQSPASPPTIESTPCPRPILKSSSLDSSSGASESPPTPSSQQFHSISPFSYAAFHPECTSVSSPILATSLDHPDYHAAPPSKRPRQLLNPEVRIPFLHHPHHHADAQNHSTYSARITGNFPKNHIPINDPVPVPTIHPKLKPLSGSCSASSREADESTYLPQYSDEHPPESHTYSHLGALAHPILLDEDRSLCTRPLKNTKRAAQNRAAQRAFRERKDRYVRELEARSVQFEEYLARYGLLEERERQIAAREAEFMHTSRQSRTINDGGSMDLKPMSSDEEKLNHIEKLEHQLNTSRQEIARCTDSLLAHLIVFPDYYKKTHGVTSFTIMVTRESQWWKKLRENRTNRKRSHVLGPEDAREFRSNNADSH
ncbi:hypothetical protein PCANC_15433 [Puccinia coronata f. sp. avenae]|uniref:BZIP domain-containing protein n=1 Tax=Puccinia coronata f. sp. avenae TaxID=200324 RepID=A0A2N5UHU3_9BASI|nr:hypothetical protein PCANC_15433 [Puccinia coronata f. sp. avenae]